MLAEVLGVGSGTFLHWALAVGLTLLVLDVFFCTEFLAWVGLGLFALWGTLLLDLPLQWSALVFMAFLAVGFAFYYTLWVQVVRRLVAGYLNRHAYKEGREQLAGRTGEIRAEGGSVMVRCGDELLAVAEPCRAGLHHGDRVTIVKYEAGLATVEKTREEER